MSTAVAEPPVEPKIDPESAPATPPEAKLDIAGAFLRPKVNLPGTEPVNPVKPVEEKKADVPVVESPKQETKKPEESWADLRKKAEDAAKLLEVEKAERTRIAAELEEAKKRPAPPEFMEKLTASEREKEEIRKELRAAALERDPLFRKEYDEQINLSAKSMLDAMVASGADPKEAQRAVNSWNKAYFAERLDEMDGVKRMEFQAAYMEAERLEIRRRSELANAEETWKRREETATAQQKAAMEAQQAQLMSERDLVLKELFSAEGLKENMELRKEAESAIDASFQFGPRQLMHSVASARLLAKAVLQKDETIKQWEEKYAAMEKRVAEQEAFIKNASGATPRISPTDPSGTEVDRAQIAKDLLNPRVVIPSAG